MNKVKIAGTIILSGFLAVYACNEYSKANPFDDVEWIEEYPGATERYVQFTPVLKSNNTPIGPAVGADFATLRFKDLNGDGVKEAIIETERWIDLGEYYHAERHVLQFRSDSLRGNKFEYVEGPELREE